MNAEDNNTTTDKEGSRQFQRKDMYVLKTPNGVFINIDKIEEPLIREESPLTETENITKN